MMWAGLLGVSGASFLAVGQVPRVPPSVLFPQQDSLGFLTWQIASPLVKVKTYGSQPASPRTAFLPHSICQSKSKASLDSRTEETDHLFSEEAANTQGDGRNCWQPSLQTMYHSHIVQINSTHSIY